MFATTTSRFAENLEKDIEKQVRKAHNTFLQRAQAGEFDPTGGVSSPYTWWNIWCLGPFLSPPPSADSDDTTGYMPLSQIPDGQVLPAKRKAYVATIIYLNPDEILSPNNLLSPATVLSNFSLPYEITYNCANLSRWALAEMIVDGDDVHNPVKKGNLIPGKKFYVDVLEFECPNEGLMEMNITVRLLGDLIQYRNAPQFAAFANWVYSFDHRQLENAFVQGDHPSNPLKFLVFDTGL
ncbi:MAG: hypothetical protein MUE44_32265 [Oscillatoriaceae cyanobacterium Prado104]|jgi:hypothetical protein|nr:hypothetical protein [Oscillatoriaceae cyanobacterium Prado104]